MTENQSPAEQLKAIIKANFLTAYIDTPTAEEMLAAVKGANLRASIEEMRAAIQELHIRNPDQPPGARDIIRQIQITRSDLDHGNGTSAAVAESRSRFIKAMRAEPDLSARWSMICNAGTKYLPRRFREDGTTEWYNNPYRLFVEKSQEACKEAQRLADINGIDYDRFYPPKSEAAAYRTPLAARA